MAYLNNDDAEVFSQTFEEWYMNKAQIRATIIDANILIAKFARASGKTEGVFGPRMIRVGWDMPGELSFLVHKSYVALMSNIVPNIRAYFAKPFGPKQKPILEEGVDYIIGSAKLPDWFKKPRYPVSYPKHSIIFRTGHHFQLASSDQPDSVAGRNGVHALIEEMKHQDWVKLKTRIFPALRGGIHWKIRSSPYYEGITGVSDAARVDLGEDDTFEDYEKLMNPELINEIWTIAKDVNDAQVRIHIRNAEMHNEKEPTKLQKLQRANARDQRMVELWIPRLREMRHFAVYYITASTFVNKDFLGPKFFKTMLDTMTVEEFLTAICNISIKQVVDMFFVGFKSSLHCFTDSYKYNSILSLDLKDTFTLTASMLKYFDPKQPLVLGYDPGFFSSIVVAQEKRRINELRVLKEFTYYDKLPQGELAKQIYEFFGADHHNKKIELYYDRAGNKTRQMQEQITTDAKLMKKELEAYGFRVTLKNEKQKTIYHYQQYKLLEILLSEKLRDTPRIRICEHECKNLRSAIFLSPKKEGENGRIELDKSSEKKIAWQFQAGLTTQLPSALIYLLFGLYEKHLPGEMKKKRYVSDVST